MPTQIVLTGVMILTLGQKAKQPETEELSEDGTVKPGAVHDNQLFNRTRDERDPDIPRKNFGIDTLRFTSECAAHGHSSAQHTLLRACMPIHAATCHLVRHAGRACIRACTINRSVHDADPHR